MNTHRCKPDREMNASTPRQAAASQLVAAPTLASCCHLAPMATRSPLLRLVITMVACPGPVSVRGAQGFRRRGSACRGSACCGFPTGSSHGRRKCRAPGWSHPGTSRGGGWTATCAQVSGSAPPGAVWGRPLRVASGARETCGARRRCYVARASRSAWASWSRPRTMCSTRIGTNAWIGALVN
jgi:hypothetical protein